MTQAPEEFTVRRKKHKLIDSSYGIVTWHAWCLMEAKRLNNAFRNRMRHEVAEECEECWIERSKVKK